MTVSRLYYAAFSEKNAELRQVRSILDARLCRPGDAAGSVFSTSPREGCEPVTPRTTAAARNFIQVRFRPVNLATAILFSYAAGFTFGMISDFIRTNSYAYILRSTLSACACTDHTQTHTRRRTHTERQRVPVDSFTLHKCIRT